MVRVIRQNYLARVIIGNLEDVSEVARRNGENQFVCFDFKSVLSDERLKIYDSRFSINKDNNDKNLQHPNLRQSRKDSRKGPSAPFGLEHKVGRNYPVLKPYLLFNAL